MPEKQPWKQRFTIKSWESKAVVLHPRLPQVPACFYHISRSPFSLGRSIIQPPWTLPFVCFSAESFGCSSSITKYSWRICDWHQRTERKRTPPYIVECVCPLVLIQMDNISWLQFSDHWFSECLFHTTAGEMCQSKAANCTYCPLQLSVKSNERLHNSFLPGIH